MIPLGMCQTLPSRSRMRVIRRLMPSTVPEAGPASMTSPTPYWSSMSMKMPDKKSRTRFWAPNPTATPTIPAPAKSGPNWNPSSPNAIRTATVQMTNAATLPRSAPTVSARRVARVVDACVLSSVPGDLSLTVPTSTRT